MAAEHREQGEEDQQEEEVAPGCLVADDPEAVAHGDGLLGRYFRVDDEVISACRHVAKHQLARAIAFAPAFAAFRAVPVGDVALRGPGATALLFDQGQIQPQPVVVEVGIVAQHEVARSAVELEALRGDGFVVAGGKHQALVEQRAAAEDEEPERLRDDGEDQEFPEVAADAAMSVAARVRLGHADADGLGQWRLQLEGSHDLGAGQILAD